MPDLEQAFTHHQAGRLTEAEALYRQILAREPEHADALHRLGVLAAQRGRYQEAVELIRRAITANEADPQYYNDLGIALHAQGRLDGAVVAYRQAVALEPTFEAYSNLGSALREQDKLTEAITAYRQALAINPGAVSVHTQLAHVLNLNGEPEAAIAAYRRALSRHPTFETYHDLGTVLHRQQQSAEAIVVFQHAIALKPDSSEAYYGLGNALRAENRLTEAVAAYEKSIRLNSNHVDALNNLGMLLQTQGKTEAALTAYQRALALEPGYVRAHSNLLYCLHYRANVDPASIFDEHRRWNHQHAAALATTTNYRHAPAPGRRLRVAYVSGDFRQHSVAHFIAPVLAQHKRDEYEVFCYSNVRQPDATTGRLQGLADHWRDIAALGDADAVELVRNDGIDILIDLAGHTAHNRLLVFACKPAPVQVTYLGYPDTTGLATIDYRLTDALADPPGQTDRFHTEELVRLPQGFLCYQPPVHAPAVGALAAFATGHVTFGSFNNPAKLNDEVIACWVEILNAVPDSRLALKGSQLGDTATAEYFRTRFVDQGIAAERIGTFPALASEVAHLEAYRHIDIALDPFPYNGTTTTCEALWMGVPVITLRGSTHAGRVGATLLSHVGLTELIADSAEEYVRLAVRLATDLSQLQTLHQGSRPRMQNSPLTAAESFTRTLEAAYRRMWVRYCENPDPRSEIQDPS